MENKIKAMTDAELAETKRKIAADLLGIRAVFFRPDDPFTWASGIKSPVYCDNRLTLTAPEVRSDVEYGLAGLIRTFYPMRRSSWAPRLPASRTRR